MLNPITWTQYFSILIALVFVYYTWVAFRFYSQDIKMLLSGKKQLASAPFEPILEEQHQPPSPAIPDQPITAPQNGDETFDRIESLIAELKVQIHTKETGTIEANLSDKLREVIQGYTDLKDSPFYPSINKMIINECRSAQIQSPDEAELQQLWQ
ncbi:hypothetical protein [Pedobacter foliorum]|uniref:hypothetical protein n=1 Tax=Pedobacter foliorum TaxID=2739058 RepID=UPI0015659AE8|nr:hypothetical protein [Pedobacter foliorum]NRF41111.1 hypothetical protein [Pedobacter foliorum]